MRVLDKIRIMSVEELAELLIYVDKDENLFVNWYRFAGDSFHEQYLTKQEAIDACINWLNSESMNGE